MSSNNLPAMLPQSPPSGGDTQPDPRLEEELSAQPVPIPEVHVPYQQLDFEETDLGMIDGRYTVLNPEAGPVARGGEAVVYKASVDAEDTARVAVKVMERYILDERRIEETSKEFAIHGLFSGDDAHPQIVDFLFGNEGNLVFHQTMERWKSTRVIVTEWMEGGTLERALFELRQNGCSEAEALWILSQLAKGVAHLQSFGIFHRDLKPLNVLLTLPVTSLLEMHLKIADFGLAGFYRNRHDRIMSMGGSGRYAPPENWNHALRVANGACNDRFDVYSLAMIVVRALFGRIPDMGPAADPPFWDSLGQKISRRGVDLLRRMLDENHTTRITIQDVLNHPWLRGGQARAAGLAIVEPPRAQRVGRKGRKRTMHAAEGPPSKKPRAK